MSQEVDDLIKKIHSMFFTKEVDTTLPPSKEGIANFLKYKKILQEKMLEVLEEGKEDITSYILLNNLYSNVFEGDGSIALLANSREHGNNSVEVILDKEIGRIKTRIIDRTRPIHLDLRVQHIDQIRNKIMYRCTEIIDEDDFLFI